MWSSRNRLVQQRRRLGCVLIPALVLAVGCAPEPPAAPTSDELRPVPPAPRVDPSPPQGPDAIHLPDSARSAAAPQTPPERERSPARAASGLETRVVTLRVLADEEYRVGRPRWRQRLAEQIRVASEVLERGAAIRLHARDYADWESPDGLRDIFELRDTVEDVDLQGADVALLLTAQHGRSGAGPRGVARYFGRAAIVRDNRSTGARARGWGYVEETIAHELAHIFGAWHVLDGRSALREHKRGGQVLDLGELPTRVLLRTREFDLARGVTSLDPALRTALSREWLAARPRDNLHPIARALRYAAVREKNRGSAQGRQRAFALHDEAIALYDAAKIDNCNGLHDALIDNAAHLHGRGQPDEALRLATRALEMCKRLRMPEERPGVAYLMRGWLLLERGQAKSALSHCREALALRLTSDDAEQEMIAEAYDYVGRCEWAIGRNDAAVQSFQLAARIYRGCGPKFRGKLQAVQTRLAAASEQPSNQRR